LQYGNWWEGDNVEEGVHDCDENTPVLDRKALDIVVREQMNFDQVVQFLDLVDDCPDAWAIAGIRDGIPARKG
jgi:hypothetical protein